MSRPIGAHFHVAHGLSNAMLLPAVTAFSAPGAIDRYAACARAMGVVKSGPGDEAAASALVNELRALNDDLDVPSPQESATARRREMGRADPTMAEQALASGSPGNNPRVPNAEEIAALYREVWGRGSGGRRARYSRYYLSIPRSESMPATRPVAVKLDVEVHARVRELARLRTVPRIT